MKTILYRIPNKYFPGVIVKKPFHAKVNYKVDNGKVMIYDVAISPLCLEHIENTRGLRKEMQKDIEKVETKAVSNSKVNPTIMNAIAPFINH